MSRKIRAEINEIESEKKNTKDQCIQELVFEKINRFDKLFTRLIKKKRRRTQINKIRNERGEITTVTKEIQRVVRKHYKQLYANKLDTLDEMEKFL